MPLEKMSMSEQDRCLFVFSTSYITSISEGDRSFASGLQGTLRDIEVGQVQEQTAEVITEDKTM